LHIGLLIYGNIQQVSGGYIYDRKLYEYLRHKKDEVSIISLPRHRYYRHLLHNFSPRLFEILKNIKLDILIQDELNHPSCFLINKRLRTRRYPVIALVHHLRSSEPHPPLQKKFFRSVEQQYLRSVDGFIFNSQNTKQVVENLAGGKPAVVAYPGKDRLSPTITCKEITARAEQPGPLRIIFVGNVIKNKGLHSLLDALRRVPKEAWALTVVGNLTIDRAYKNMLLHQIEKNRMVEHVRLTGLVSDSGLIARLRNSHVLVMPSAFEGFGLAYMEAMGFGLPVIGSTEGGGCEFIQHGRNGFLIKPGDSVSLTQHLHQLHRDRTTLLEMSLEARRTYGQWPTWTTTTECIRNLLLSFVHN